MLTILKRYNTTLILLSVVFAVVFGMFTPHIFVKIEFIGELFINLLKLFALPLIASALISSIGAMDKDISKLKKLAKYMISFMVLSEIIAVSIALVLFNTFKPGIGFSPEIINQGSAAVTHSSTEVLNVSNFLMSIVPENIFDSLAKFQLLPVVFFSISFGIAVALCGDAGRPVYQFFNGVKEVTSKCLSGIMMIAPLGIFALVGNGVAAASMAGNLHTTLFALLKFVVILFIGLFLHALWQFIGVVVFNKNKISTLVRESTPVFMTAFGTSSSVATLPTAFQAADNLGGDKTVTRFMLPIIASINIGGMMMYEVAAALFFTQVLGIDLSLSQQILLAVTCILGGMAEGGIPESSMVSLIVVFKLVNIPISAISILLPLDRIIDRVRTMVNIFGNMAGALIVSSLIKKKGLD